MNQELMYEAQELEKYTAELEEHVKFLQNQIEELKQFAERLTSLGKSNEKDILASIGKGVYLPAELKDKNLLVEVGAGVIVKKTPEGLKEVVIDQISKLEESKVSMVSQIGLYTQKIQEIMLQVQTESASAKQ